MASATVSNDASLTVSASRWMRRAVRSSSNAHMRCAALCSWRAWYCAASRRDARRPCCCEWSQNGTYSARKLAESRLDTTVVAEQSAAADGPDRPPSHEQQ